MIFYLLNILILVIFMKVRLGYIGSPTTLEGYTYSKTITYTNFQKLQKNEKLLSITKENLEHLKKILQYNLSHKITFYRLSHNIVPLATHPNIQIDFVTPFSKKWKELGNFIIKNNMRIDTHPDQFYVLNSTNEIVVKNTIVGLEYHKKLFEALNIKGFCILHIGSTIGGKKEAINRFKKNFNKLPIPLKKLIILENDDKTFTVEDTLTLCEELQIPMVLDYHHYQCNKNNEKLEKYLTRIFNTWKNSNLPPKIHFSSPKNKKEKRSHSFYINYKDFIKFLNKIKNHTNNIDIMLECKGKDASLFRLTRQLKFFTNYKFINPTTFIVK